jgi:hypothetical protein
VKNGGEANFALRKQSRDERPKRSAGPGHRQASKPKARCTMCIGFFYAQRKILNRISFD